MAKKQESTDELSTNNEYLCSSDDKSTSVL
jgi:hypothetical protein